MVKWFYSIDSKGLQVGTNFASIMSAIAAGYGQTTATSVSVKNGLAKVTIPSGNSYFFEPGTVVLISGSTTPGINGEHKVVATHGNTIFYFETSVTGTVTGGATVKVAPLSLPVTNPVTNVYYYQIGGRYLKAKNYPSAYKVEFAVTDDMLDTNITPACVLRMDSPYAVFSDGSFFYFITSSGALVFTPLSTSYYLSGHNIALANPFGDFVTNVGYMSPTITAKARGFFGSYSLCDSGRTTASDYFTDVPISIWEGDNKMHGFLPNMAELVYARSGNDYLSPSVNILYVAKKTYVAFKGLFIYAVSVS